MEKGRFFIIPFEFMAPVESRFCRHFVRMANPDELLSHAARLVDAKTGNTDLERLAMGDYV